MKITIPAGSIIVLPKGNSKDVAMTNDRPLAVDPRSLEVYRTWGDYIRGIEFALVKFLDPVTAVRVALRKAWERYGEHAPEDPRP